MTRSHAANSSSVENNSDSPLQHRKPASCTRARIVNLRLDVLLMAFMILNLLGTFIAFYKSNIEPTERRLQSTSTIPDEAVATATSSNSDYNGQEDRMESLRRLQQLISGSPSNGVLSKADNHTTTTTDQLHLPQPHLLPRWSHDVVSNYGSKPVILGLETCSTYRNRVIRQRRRLMAPAGMFHTGTSLLVTLLEDHCHFASDYGLTERTSHQGLHGQVPWGKNNPASFRTTEFSAVQYWEENRVLPRQAILPIVTIAHPYHWMSNMCRQPFTANWNVPPAARRRQQQQQPQQPQDPIKPCPYVVRGKNNHPVAVTVRYGNDETVQYESLAHLWNKWNREYFDSRAYPRLMIRYEDLLFHPEQVVKEVCSCVGGDYYHLDQDPTLQPQGQEGSSSNSTNNNIVDPIEMKRRMMNDPKYTTFHYTAADNVEETGDWTSLAEAWIRYGKTPSLNRSSAVDQMFTQHILDKDMLRAFHYKI